MIKLKIITKFSKLLTKELQHRGVKKGSIAKTFSKKKKNCQCSSRGRIEGSRAADRCFIMESMCVSVCVMTECVSVSRLTIATEPEIRMRNESSCSQSRKKDDYGMRSWLGGRMG